MLTIGPSLACSLARRLPYAVPAGCEPQNFGFGNVRFGAIHAVNKRGLAVQAGNYL